MSEFSASYKSKLQKYVLYKLYDEYEESLNEESVNIMQRNNKLNNYTYAMATKLVYKGNFYVSHPNRVIPAQVVRVSLNPKIAPELDAFILIADNLQKEKLLIAGYIRKILNLCQNFNDIRALIPTNMFEVMPPMINVGNAAQTLTTEVVDTFTEENSRFENILKQRLLENILIDKRKNYGT